MHENYMGEFARLIVFVSFCFTGTLTRSAVGGGKVCALNSVFQLVTRPFRCHLGHNFLPLVLSGPGTRSVEILVVPPQVSASLTPLVPLLSLPHSSRELLWFPQSQCEIQG